jgi:protein-tyrosine phosphatase
MLRTYCAGKLDRMLSAPVRVCFVCSGNICRSPTAEVVLRRLVAESGQPELVTISSAGTGDWHAGDDMDERSRLALVQAGYAVEQHVARQFQPADFDELDLVVALDKGHRSVLWWLAAETSDTDSARAKIVLLREFDPELRPGESPDVADPYYSNHGGFRLVLEQVERSCAQLLAAIERAVRTGSDTVQQTERPPR